MNDQKSDLIGKTGEIRKSIIILDANNSIAGTSVRVKEDADGEEYWTLLDSNITLD